MSTLTKHGGKATWKLHPNAESCFEYILEATSLKTARVRPPTSYHTSGVLLENQGRTYNWRFLMNPTHRHGNVGRRIRIYVHQVYVDTECKDLLRAMHDRDGWWQSLGLVWFGSVLCHINHSRSSLPNPFSTYVLDIWLIFLNEAEPNFLKELKSFTSFYQTRICS